VEAAVVGAGTVLTERDLDAALAAGAEFIVTPGLTERLLQAALDRGRPFIPGVATASEIMLCLEHGLDTLKFFPAEAAGGAPALKAIGGPFPQAGFCPTGGIGPGNIAGYLALASVISVGGSWLMPEQYLATGNWEGITRLAREAVQLVRAVRPAV
jgi:2-dehydro-3-deoxyphosphogluconate aldolase / (4S)-4-hydroxy-2-oxoglutarate aldolase